MKHTGRKLLGVVVALVTLGSALPASADGRHGDDRHRSQREWRDDRSDRHWRATHRREVIRERVVERRWAPMAYGHDRHRHHHGHRYEPRTVVRQSNYYYTSPPVAYYDRNPAVVIGFNIPPLVIPLR